MVHDVGVYTLRGSPTYRAKIIENPVPNGAVHITVVARPRILPIGSHPVPAQQVHASGVEMFRVLAVVLNYLQQ